MDHKHDYGDLGLSQRKYLMTSLPAGYLTYRITLYEHDWIEWVNMLHNANELVVTAIPSQCDGLWAQGLFDKRFEISNETIDIESWDMFFMIRQNQYHTVYMFGRLFATEADFEMAGPEFEYFSNRTDSDTDELKEEFDNG